MKIMCNSMKLQKYLGLLWITDITDIPKLTNKNDLENHLKKKQFGK